MNTGSVAGTTQAGRGTYLLLAQLSDACDLRIGSLGSLAFPAGWYGYAGSALGPGGLAARLARHRRADKRLHWHIDYLLPPAVLRASWQIDSSIRLECAWASALARLTGAEPIVPRFGASDCRCRAHLCYWKRRPLDSMLRTALEQASRDAGVADAGALLTFTRYDSSIVR